MLVLVGEIAFHPLTSHSMWQNIFRLLQERLYTRNTWSILTNLMKVTGIKAIHVLPGGLIFSKHALECDLEGSKLRQIQAYRVITPMNYRLGQKTTTTYIYMSKQPLDVSDWEGYWLTLIYAHDQITKTREWWKMTTLYQYVKLQDSSQDYLTLQFIRGCIM